MRPAGRGELDSLYFTYPEFACPSLDAVASRGKSAPVVIVGAGPIGLTAALTLARYGIACTVIEKKTTFNDGSRAICIARQSMQIFEQLGVVGAFLSKALPWQRGRSFYRGQEVLCFDMPHGAHEKYAPMYNLQQQYIEQYLYEAATHHPLIDIRWGSEVTALEQDEQGVRLSVSSQAGDYNLACGYCLAADGARSAIRSMMGLRLAGENYEGRYVIADVQMDHDYPTERRAFFEPASNPGGTILIHRQPDNIWRIDYQLGAGEEEAEAIREETIRARVGAILSEIGHNKPWALEWWSIYSANTLCLDDYMHRRVSFIGDSAHIVPIFGVRGLNNGIADAFNMGWKLAYHLEYGGSATLLPSYTPERRGATLDVFANATKSTRFMTPPTRGWDVMRQAALSLSVSHDFARGFANPRQMQPYSYAHGPLTAAADASFDGGPVAGAVALNAPVAGGFLLERRGRGFSALAFVDAGQMDRVEALFAQCRALDRLFAGVMVSHDPLKGVIHDQDGAIARLYAAKPGAIYLLRPDQHIVGRWLQASDADVLAALSRFFGSAA